MPDESPAILYVDDEPINLRVFETNFKGKFPIVTCQSASEALSMLQARAHEIGILIADQRMPEITGVELLEKARDLAPDVQRMIITAFSDMQAVLDAVNRGQVTRYFVKPWIREDLLAALESSMRFVTLQARLREMESRMLRSERLVTIGQVSAGVAHELMNPVSYMTQNVVSLRSELKVLIDFIRSSPVRPTDEVEETLRELPQIIHDIETGAHHIQRVALRQRGQVRGDDDEGESDLADVVELATKLARAEVHGRARLSVEGRPVGVKGGSVKLCQVLLNLVVNAAQAMEGSGSDRRGHIQVSWKEEGDQVVLAVTDNGRGIPPELQTEVFEPFFTTKSGGQGTGLGLSISRELVQAIGGEISLQSTFGVGTTVEVVLRKAPRN